MSEIIKMTFFASLTVTVAALIFGLIAYFSGGVLNQRYGNKAMRWRVLFQGVTLLLFLCLLLIR